MSDLTVVLSADSSQLQQNLNDAKNILKRYKQEADKVKDVTKAQIESFNKSVNSLNRLTNSAKTNAQQMSGLKKQLIELSTQYNSLSVTAKNSDFGKALASTIRETQKRYDELKRTVDDVNKSLGETAKQTQNIKGVLNQISQKTVGVDFSSLTKVGAVVGTVGLVANEFKRSAEMAVQFEDALSNLSAITGLKGKELEGLKQQVIETGNATSKAFSDIADSYTKVGSKMPELLKQPKALDEVTRAVITLSKAARMTVDESTDALLGIMNQMGASASEAATYINVLAAGSKNGAGDIKYLAEAFNQCGTASATAGLSIQQATALIEVLAQKIPNAGTAGTNLRNILLKLATDADNSINPTVVGLDKALENLAKHADDTAYMTKKFGTENVSAAITLAKSRDKADELTKAVTGTNEAEAQAKTQTDNVAGAVKKLTQDWDNFVTELNNSTGVLKTVIGLLDKVVLGWKNALSAKSAYENNKTSENKGANDAQTHIENNKTSAKGSTSKDRYADYQRKMRIDIKFYEDERRKTLEKITSKTPEQQRKELSALASRYEGTINTLKTALTSVKESDFETVKAITKTTTTSNTTSTNTKSDKTTNTTKTLTENQKAINDYRTTVDNLKVLVEDGLISQTQYDLSLVKEQNTLLDKLEKNWAKATEAEKKYYSEIGNEKLNNLRDNTTPIQGVNIADSLKTNIEFKPLPKIDTQIDTINEYDEAIRKLTDDLANLTIGSAAYQDVLDKLTALEDRKAEQIQSVSNSTKGLSSNALNAAQGVSQLGSSFSSLGNSLGIPEINVAGVMAQAIANTVLSYSKALEMASTLGPWAWVGFGATGLAELVSIVGSMKSVGKYADGGIIGGTTTIGDFNFARVNKGEMILNGTQQQHLFNILNSSGGANVGSHTNNGEVKFKIEGKQLVGVLKNYNISNSKLR